MVHSKLVGSAPPLAVTDSVKATFEPGVVLPELKDNDTCCATAELLANTAKVSQIAKGVKPVIGERRSPCGAVSAAFIPFSSPYTLDTSAVGGHLSRCIYPLDWVFPRFS
jgi:hypothetical protein